MKIFPARALSPISIELINHYQGGFPLSENPYDSIADHLGCTAKDIIDTLEKLMQGRWLTRFGPLYDAAALGGGLSLAALSADEQQYDQVADIINGHPQVAHNYRREHELNMWFVIATEKPEQVEQTVSEIEQETGLRVYNFPKLQEYYIGLWLQLNDGRIDTTTVPHSHHHEQPYRQHPIDRKLISLTQSGLPLTTTPWNDIAHQLGISAELVIQRMQHLLDAGIVRRIGLVPNHYKLGLRANGMTVWDVADDQIDRIGSMIGRFDFVSHCYHRPRHTPVWRYNLFAMVHGHDRDEVEMKKMQIASAIGSNCLAHDVLYSSRILKKTGLRLAA